MSELKYTIGVYAKNTRKFRVSSEALMIFPGNYRSVSEWISSDWNENNRSRKLMQAIGSEKKFGFLVGTDQSSYWSQLFRQEKNIEMAVIHISTPEFIVRNHLYDVKVVAPSMFPFPINNESVLLFYSFEFQSSDIKPTWSLNNSD